VQQPMSALPPIATLIAHFADLHRLQTEPAHRSSSARSSACNGDSNRASINAATSFVSHTKSEW